MMAVMDVRDVGMIVLKGFVPVLVGVRVRGGVKWGVLVLVVFVVRMAVLVLQGVMHMDVLVVFTEQ